ncbi:MAG: hypothetical protein AAFX39_11160 [Pseudomonadota bacterium]
MHSLSSRLKVTTLLGMAALMMAACQSTSVTDSSSPAAAEVAAVTMDINDVATWNSLIAVDTAGVIAGYSPTELASLPPVAQPDYQTGYERVAMRRDGIDGPFQRRTAQYLGPEGEGDRIRILDANGVPDLEIVSRGDWWYYVDAWETEDGASGGSRFRGDMDAIFPLQPGNVALVEYDGWQNDGSTFDGMRVCGVMRAESISVPSGTYPAMRVECRSGADTVEELMTSPYRVHVMWVSPDTGDIVAYVDQEDGAFRRTWYVDA